MYIPIISSIIDGVKEYAIKKQEVNAKKAERKDRIEEAKTNAEINKINRESEQDFSLDQISMKNMEKSWKDELLLIIWLIPLVLCFIPGYATFIEDGFKVLKNSTPDWYQYILIAMVVVIYGLRGLLRAFMQIIISKIGGVK